MKKPSLSIHRFIRLSLYNYTTNINNFEGKVANKISMVKPFIEKKKKSMVSHLRIFKEIFFEKDDEGERVEELEQH